MFNVDPERMEKFRTLFGLERKKDIESFCKDWVIKSEELSAFIFAGMAGELKPYLHLRHHVDLEPKHLYPTQEELNALGQNGVGKLEGKAAKAVSKIFQMFEQRKMISVHIFYHPDKLHWHMFHFNQRDTVNEDNHWNLGPHIHYTHDTFVNVTLDEILETITSENPRLPKSIHIKYDYHHNRDKKNA